MEGRFKCFNVNFRLLYIYIYMCVCVCVCVRASVGVCNEMNCRMHCATIKMFILIFKFWGIKEEKLKFLDAIVASVPQISFCS